MAELLVVMGVVGLILAAAIAARPKAAATRVAVAARAIAATMQLARANAMASNMETVVRIDTRSGRFGPPGSMHSLPRGMQIALTVADAERAGDTGGIRFYPDGQSSGGVIALTLDKSSAGVAVNWLTGEPRLVK
ncbi:GspH/FimT family pseudopilin [Bradyrhizobium lablabi]|nr:GspH/FimT family pseudopilin [Bradyrhizobium lablabi]